MAIASYSPDEVHCLVFGIPMYGFADGGFITVNKDVAPFTTIKTPDGTIARLYNRDQTYTITLTLHRGSVSNDVLTKLWQLDEVTQLGKFPVLIKDLSGSDLFFSATTWIEGLPIMSQSTNYDVRTWVLKSSSAVINFGSNNDASSILEDLFNLATASLPTIDEVL